MSSAPDRPSAVAAVIFDFDGTLMDTETTSFESWRYEWGQWGLTLDPSQHVFANHGGDVSAERYAALARAVGSRYDQSISHARRTEYREKLHESLDVGAGMRDWIRDARFAGIRLAIASSSERSWLYSHLGRAGLLKQFDVIVGGDEVSDHKPHPAIYQLALDRLGIAADHAIAVEDTAHGVLAAQAAGLGCIAIPNPFVSPDAVGFADLVLASPEEMSLSEAAQWSVSGRTERLRNPASREDPR